MGMLILLIDWEWLIMKDRDKKINLKSIHSINVATSFINMYSLGRPKNYDGTPTRVNPPNLSCFKTEE